MAYQPSSSALRATPAEVARRNGISPALATSREARAAEPAPGPPPDLKGAVKVAGFPAHSPYPFREIAADGGVWKLDPAAFLWRGKPIKDVSIRAAASSWATGHGLKAKVVLDGGHVYVQFRRGD
jgi:hypothetical protein